VQVDGVLRIGDPPPEFDGGSAAIPTTGPLFTNEASGVLAGTGTIAVSDGQGSIQNFGTIAPGGVGTIGTLTLGANLFMEDGSTFAVDLLNTSSHDRLVVTGSVAATSGTTVAVNLLPGASFMEGDTFRVVQSGGLDATTLPKVDKPQLRDEASGNDLLLVATSLVGPQLVEAQQQANNQVTTFADLFVKMSEDQDKERIGKDDIVVTDTACTTR